VPPEVKNLTRSGRYGARAMSVFRESELRYLAGGRQLGRLATVGADGTPHVVPVAWIYNAVRDTIDVGGSELAETKKFRDVARSGRAAIVVDDVGDGERWRPRGIEVRGRGEAIAIPTPLIRIHPERIVSWGLPGGRSARTVGTLREP
jgi:pyridoxamine 5'-phosphate oxidase family protein